ncbi:hypothetical protein [Sodalis-like endosymbiont of Proechinophthirus fluctus]|uniref:hypothetical protein n=1 Tax=Sodalis-like endosymbiont of Proechinophthirus fluctus TaxID=1462730 RepID=UPI00082B124E|nr:hypothetical protein [Sodalis-like endosymbiont of Proechinophthirus fluctus]
MHQEYVSDIEVIHAVLEDGYTLPLPTLFFTISIPRPKRYIAISAMRRHWLGFHVTLPDTLMHGARFEGDEQCRLRHFLDILRNNIDEIARAVCALSPAGSSIDGRRID